MAKGFRIVLLLVAGGAIVALGAGVLLAADGEWPAATVGKDFRGPGGYLSWIKIAAYWLLFLLWVHTTNWVSIDAQELKLDYSRWNPIIFGTFMAALVLMWLIPYFWIGFFLLVITFVVPLATYVVKRNATVDNDQRVMTPEHLRYWFATKLNKIGVKVATERRDPHEEGAPVKLLPFGGPDERTDTARLLLARQSPGMGVAREILAESLAGRGSAIMLDYTQQGVAVRTMVDGVWIARQTKPRELADPALETLKLLCGLNPKDRQNRQAGTFAAEYESDRFTATFTSQGTPGGERVAMQFEEKKIRLQTLDELGMRTKLQEQLMELLSAKKGLVLFSAPVANGLRTTMDVVLRSCDRYTREFAAVEDEDRPFAQVENVPVTTYKAADGQTPADVLVKLFRTDPNVVVVRELVNAQTVSMLCQEIAEENRLMIGTVRAKDCAEAMLRVLGLGVPPAEFAAAIHMVVGQRLVRRLCDACKEAYTPPPQVLQQLGIPAGRVQAFYRPRQPNPEEPKEVCGACGGIGYLGRTAIFEVLAVGDAVRKTLSSGPKLDLLRQAARKDGMKNLQEEGVLLVVKGMTSLPELMRVLKQ
jgi:type II secretory ATPase GspE/PulE/Tfp pilus assembly ATPase PilB-like protein